MRKQIGPYESFNCVVCGRLFQRKVGGNAKVCGKVRCCKLKRAFGFGKEIPFDPGSAAERSVKKTYFNEIYDGISDVDA